MCNCMNEVAHELQKAGRYESVEAPTDLLSGKAYLEFAVKEKGKKRERKIPVVLPRCPICGVPYYEERIQALKFTEG